MWTQNSVEMMIDNMTAIRSFVRKAGDRPNVAKL